MNKKYNRKYALSMNHEFAATRALVNTYNRGCFTKLLLLLIWNMLLLRHTSVFSHFKKKTISHRHWRVPLHFTEKFGLFLRSLDVSRVGSKPPEKYRETTRDTDQLFIAPGTHNTDCMTAEENHSCNLLKRAKISKHCAHTHTRTIHSLALLLKPPHGHGRCASYSVLHQTFACTFHNVPATA